MGSCGRRGPGRTPLLPTCLLLAIALPGSQNGKDAVSSCTLKRTVGESVELPLNLSLHHDIREIEWTWHSEDDKKQLLVSWKPSSSQPDWYDFEKQYRSRFQLTEKALSIKNLTTEMGGFYIANIKFRSGKSQEEPFRLCIYEPIPHPHIQIHSLSSTSGWCNLSLECETPGTTENLAVTWLSKGLPRELEHSGALGSAPSSRKLSLSLPWNQSNGLLTCVVSSPADEKNATLSLKSICSQRGSLQSKWLWSGILPMVLVAASLMAGIWFWMRKKRLTDRGVPSLLPAVPGSAAAPQTLDTEDSAALQARAANSPASLYAEIVPLHQPKDTEEGGGRSHGPTCTPAMHTLYEPIRARPDPQWGRQTAETPGSEGASRRPHPAPRSPDMPP